MGILALALVIALGAMGVAYSAWTEDLYINSTVQLGNLDIDICGTSSTFVYKVPGLGMTQYGQDIQVDYYYTTDPNPYTPPAEGTLVAQANTQDTSQETDDVDSVLMTFEGVFPDIDFMTDIELKYLGSIPAKVSLVEISSDDDIMDELQQLWQYGDITYAPNTYGIWIDAELSTDDGTTWIPVPSGDLELLGLPLEQDDLLHIQMHVLLPEEPDYEHLNLSFTGLISVVQWNEYEET
jgi:hypothetical protein